MFKIPFYPPEIKDALNRMTPIADLMREEGERVVGSGRVLSFFCPICGGDDGNGKINVEGNFFKCFRCEALGGSFQGLPINYLQLRFNFTLPEAIEYLANRNNVELPRADYSQSEKLKNQLFNDVRSFYSRFRAQSDYLQKRGVSPDVMKKYDVGYAPGGDALKRYLLRKGYSLDLLREHWLVGDNLKDRFFKRVIVPIASNGYTYDFYGRRTDGGDQLKHLYLQGRQPLVFGSDSIPEGVSNVDVYESIINKLVAESFGYPHGIAIGGCTKFSPTHLNFLLKKKPKCVRLIFDPDLNGQGQTAMFRVGETLVKKGLQVKVVLLPLGVDAADLLATQGAAAFQDCLKAALDYEDYRAHFLMKDIHPDYISKHLHWRYDLSFTLSHFPLLKSLFWESSQQ